MARLSARNSAAPAEAAIKTPGRALRPLSTNTRIGGVGGARSNGKHDNTAKPTMMATTTTTTTVVATTTTATTTTYGQKTPAGKRLLQQQTPTSAYSTVKRPRITPGRGWTKATTPHGARALEARKAGLTPGRTARRQSGRLRRESQRDILRALTRALPKRKTPEKEVLEPTMEVKETTEHEESSSDAEIGSPPRLSFGMTDEENSAFEIEKSRRASLRLSLGDNTLLGADLNSVFEDDDDDDIGEKPTTQLLDESLDSEDLALPDEPTFEMKDTQGDTVALRELIRLARSPATPEIRDPYTPTAEMSFALDIPDFSIPKSISNVLPRTPEQPTDFEEEGEEFEDEEDKQDDDIDTGGFDIAIPEENLAVADIHWDSDEDGRTAPLQVASTKPLDIRLAQIQADEQHPLKSRKRAPRRLGLSKGIVKRVATSFLSSSGIKKPRLKRGAVDALMQATDWFFEQASEDLAAYSEHAGRKRIDESDFLLLARRQRLLTPKSTLFSLANKFLPRELVQNVRDAGAEPGGRRKPGRRKEGREADEET